MRPLFQHLVDAALIDTVRGCDVVLEFSSPVPQPNVHRIITRQAVAFFHCLMAFGKASGAY